MGSYIKTNYIDGQAPARNAANLNNTENGVANAHTELNQHTLLIAENSSEIANNKSNITKNSNDISSLAVGEVYKGTFTPIAGSEYPASGISWSYYISGVSDVGYTFTTGLLIGKTARNMDKIIYSAAGWSLVQNATVSTQPKGYNFIRNGVNVWQRGENINIGVADQFAQDGWRVRGTNGTGGSTNVSKVIEGITKTKYIVNGHTSYFSTYIAIKDLTQFSGKNLTFSIKSAFGVSSITTFSCRFYGVYGTGGSASEVYGTVTFNSAGTASITIPDLSAKTIGANNYLQVLISSVTALPSQTFKFWDYKLEEGLVATPFEHRPYELELSLCQCYYERIGGVAAQPLCSISYYGSTTCYGVLNYTKKRGIPTSIEISSQTGFSIYVVTSSNLCSAVNTAAVTDVSARIGFTTPASTSGFSGWAIMATSTDYIAINAEL